MSVCILLLRQAWLVLAIFPAHRDIEITYNYNITCVITQLCCCGFHVVLVTGSSTLTSVTGDGLIDCVRNYKWLYEDVVNLCESDRLCR